MAKTILVIEDDPTLLRAMQRMIETAGYDCIGAHDGGEGVRLFRSRHPDLVITDIQMPEKNGLELVRDIRGIDPDARIIAVSGGGFQGNQSDLQMAKIFGASVSLQKPFHMHQLLQAVQQALAA